MDSDPPSIDGQDPTDTPFASASAQGKSRIADQMARQRADQRSGQPRSTRPIQRLPATSPASGQRYSPDVKPAPKPPEKQRIKTRTSDLRKLNQKVEDHIASLPAFSISMAGIVRLRWLVGMQSLAIVVLLGMLGYSFVSLNERNIYAALSRQTPVRTTDADGQPLPTPGTSARDAAPRQITAMNMPTYTRQAILGWASTTATAIMNFGFHNAGDKIGAQRNNFTDRGWNAFITAITDSNIMDKIVANEQVITAAPVGAPVIVRVTDMPDGNREWIVQIPFMITVLSGKKTEPKTETLTLTIVKVPPLHNLAGLGIDNWIER